MSAADLKARIQSADDLYEEKVEVPEWDVTIMVRTPTNRQRNHLMKQYSTENGQVDTERMFPALLVLTACDPETGEYLFTDADIDWLSDKSALALDKVAEAAMRVAGMGDQAKAIDRGKVDSSETQPDATSSDSPSV